MGRRERIRDGLRRYLVTFIDPASRLAFAFAIPSKSARHTQAALQATLALLPAQPQVLLSDNGSEFEAGFAQTCKAHGIQRWYTYPKTPKMNAHAERFNRTLQESFVTQRPHYRLGQQSPLSFLLHHQPECQRWWTHTPP